VKGCKLDIDRKATPTDPLEVIAAEYACGDRVRLNCQELVAGRLTIYDDHAIHLPIPTCGTFCHLSVWFSLFRLSITLSIFNSTPQLTYIYLWMYS